MSAPLSRRRVAGVNYTRPAVSIRGSPIMSVQVMRPALRSRPGPGDPVSPGAEAGAAERTARLKEAVLAWGRAHFVPLDAEALDPPAVCDRCHQPIAPGAPVDYRDRDGQPAITHESCPGESSVG
jgi:hypothetical protein